MGGRPRPGPHHVRRMRYNVRNMRKSLLQALFPQVRRGILSATLTRRDKWWYLSELAGFLRTKPSSLQRELAALMQCGILEQRKEGRRTYFKADTRSPVFGELQGLFEKTKGIVPLLKGALKPFEDRILCAFVYGSVARGEEQAASDVDLMVIGKIGTADLVPALAKVEKRVGREINITNYSPEEFRKKMKQGNHFLTTVLVGSLEFVKGEQRDLDAITGK